ncbi:hypothetical protein [Geminisphaera colitermitum]|uniref:hypothetical protein n=1 Tax=Geminisphaera colitermitum TaxID=1148786 RepID=UPI0012FF4252|nr:hypothetical protein [Geminisphaera colitermitum]
MGRKTRNADTLGIHLPDAHTQIIADRAAALGMTKSKFGAGIIARWIAEGCPAISEPDRLMQLAKESAVTLPVEPKKNPAANATSPASVGTPLLASTAGKQLNIKNK